ncbi:hypothetical protein C900_02443 [Fulvivirga imtechensis AK7]|uniref:Protein containing aminopeptidase domain protein n=1 Tax=Fulvivirga imtechensis AK7 TaxID=1237149 RepID=L8JRZ3_9BACT|nr:DUF4910 domain-containing protein [Fulvivirga imtechensis]ELR71635.1 hypothetical protein C900_02443 [Fulvivirga imtechensis AK7]
MQTLQEVLKETPVTGHAVGVGKEMYALAEELYPLCRSITGAGTRRTLEIIKRHIPLVISKIPSGTKVFDWEVPKEWNIRDAYVLGLQGQKVIDFQKSNLHVVNYSSPVHKKMPLQELRQHIHTLPEYPDWIPYRTTYYKEDWGFCMSHRQLQGLEEGTYDVYIDSSLENGYLTFGELLVKGKQKEEVLISTHICHPSLCNDNLSGISMVTFLAKHLIERKNRYSYRFLFIPGTIGAITWLSINELKVGRIRHGLIAALLGDAGPFTYKRSRRGDAEIDQVVQYVLERNDKRNKVIDFVPYGYDERQFCSPGFDMPVGCLTRTPYGEYPEYHTSADNLEFISAHSLEGSFEVYSEIIDVLESNRKYVNLLPKCEPQLGKRGLYDTMGGNNDAHKFQLALLWVLNMSEGEHSLLDIARRSAIDFETLAEAASQLEKRELIKARGKKRDQ